MIADGAVQRRPGGLVTLVAFFGFGAMVAGLTVLMLLVPGSWADSIWRLRPSARSDFYALGSVAVPLMLLVSIACAGAAVGLWRGRRWGHRIAVAVLGVNLIGDVMNAVLRHDWRTLIGVPIGGAMLIYLTRSTVRDRF